MKKHFRIYITLAFLISSQMIVAQLFSTIHQYADFYFPATIYFEDGHSETHEGVSMPHQEYGSAKTANLHAYDGKKSEKITIDPAEVTYIHYWHKDYTDKTIDLVRIFIPLAEDAKNWEKNITQTTFWGVPVAASRWGAAFAVYTTYNFDKSKKAFVGELYSSSNRPAVMHVLLRRHDGKVSNLGGSWTGSLKDWYFPDFSTNKSKKKQEMLEKKQQYYSAFKDNPDIYNAFLNDQLRTSNIQYILDEMERTLIPAVPEEKQQQTNVVVTEQEETNGVEGDDM